jgi:hypothetical protein
MTIVSPAQHGLDRLFSLPSAGGKEAYRPVVGIGATALATSLDGNLAVTTAEGDRVTLSAKVTKDFRSLLYRGTVRFDEVLDVEALEQDSAASRDIGLVVDGHLNGQERDEIIRLFKTAGRIFREVFTGQNEAGLAQTISLTDQFAASSTLSALELNLHVQRSVTVATAGQSVADSAAPSGADTPGAASQARMVIPSVSLGTTAPTQLFPLDLENRADALAERLLKTIDSGRLRRSKLREFLAQLLERAQQEARESSEIDGEQTAIADRAREKVLERTNEPEKAGRVFVAVLSYSRSFVKQTQYDVLG